MMTFDEAMNSVSKVSDAMLLLQFRDIKLRKVRASFDTCKVKNVLVKNNMMYRVVEKSRFSRTIVIRGMFWIGNPPRESRYQLIEEDEISKYWSVSLEDGITLAKIMVLMDSIGNRDLARHRTEQPA